LFCLGAMTQRFEVDIWAYMITVHENFC
jgi:hypothetical protein